MAFACTILKSDRELKANVRMRVHLKEHRNCGMMSLDGVVQRDIKDVKLDNSTPQAFTDVTLSHANSHVG